METNALQVCDHDQHTCLACRNWREAERQWREASEHPSYWSS